LEHLVGILERLLVSQVVEDRTESGVAKDGFAIPDVLSVEKQIALVASDTPTPSIIPTDFANAQIARPWIRLGIQNDGTFDGIDFHRSLSWWVGIRYFMMDSSWVSVIEA
jgi:hypothetical protein